MERQKGSAGTILIIGGSNLYTGAPFFTGSAAFKSGAEMLYIFTTKSAKLPLKILLPAAIILQIPSKNFKWILNRIHICIFGPGLGRSMKYRKRLLTIISQLTCPIILDGDGLFFFHKNKIKYDGIIATPNYNEVKYLQDYYETIIYKGYSDIIMVGGMRYQNNTGHILVKRVVGQGDLICGILAAKLIGREENEYLKIIKIVLKMIRKWGERAYEKYGEGVTIENIIAEMKYFKV